MATKKTENTDQNKLIALRLKLSEVKLNIKAGIEKNTNAHKPLKKEVAQLLTKINQ